MPGQNQQSTNQAQSSKTDPWLPTQDLLKDILGKYSGQNTDVTGGQQSALDAMQTAAGAIPGTFGASSGAAINNLFDSTTQPQVGMLQDAYGNLQKSIGTTASGAELDPYSTPGFSDALRTTMDDITKQVKGVYAGSGRDPSGAGSFAQSLGRGLTQGVAPLLSSQFNTNKQYQMAAANNLFGAGGSTAGAITGQNQVPLTNAASAVGMLPSAINAYLAAPGAQLGAANTSFQQPYTNLAQLLNPIAGIAGLGNQASGTGTSTTIQPQSTMGNLMGGVSGAAGILSLLSDERTKTHVEKIGMLNDGQSVVRFKYRGDPVTRVGLIAQEVERFAPHAVHDIGGGIKAVEHEAATEHAAELGRAA